MVEAPMMHQVSNACSDDELLSEFLTRRSEVAFERLVIRYGPLVLRTCRDILGDHSAAEDAFQATFLVLFRQSGSIRDRNSVGRWLYEVACRVARRARVGDSKRRSQERRALVLESVMRPDHEVSDREWRPILHEEIDKLPGKLRDAIICCYLEGLTIDAAARKLNCPPGTLKSRLRQGRDLLRSRLTRRGLAASAVLLLMFSIEHPAEASEIGGRLIHATVATAMGDSKAVPRQVEAMATAEEPGRSGVIPRSLAGLIVCLIIYGGCRWSAATSAVAIPVPPVAIKLGTQFFSMLSRVIPNLSNSPEARSHCQSSR